MNPSARFFGDSLPLRCILRFLVASVLSIAIGRQAYAIDIFWRLPNGGAFSSTASWSGGLVPSNTDIANFSVNTTPPPFLPPPYTVTFSANVTNQALVIHDDLVVFDLNTRTYATTTAAGVAVGTVAGRTGSLTVTDGTINVTAGLATPTINIGAVANSSGGFLVTGGGRITGTANLNVGHLHSGGLTVQSGGTISLGTNTSTIIGNNAGVGGVATITGIGSALTTNGLTVGNSGNGTLDLSILGLLQVNANSVMGNNAGSTATANVTSSAQWITTGNLTVGNSGQGTLNISALGLVRNVNGVVGVSGFGGSGTVTVEGGNSLWDNTGSLIVGDGGTGQVFITNQGKIRNTTGTLGGLGGGGTLTVNDAGSQWLNSGQLVVGGLGGGTLNINAGGFVQNTAGIIGNGVFLNSRGNGTVNVDGPGSVWTNTLDLTVGNAGTGRLNITGGGTVTNTAAIVGDDAGSDGTVTVEDSLSVWNSGALFVGNGGTGEVFITGGGRVNSGGIGAVLGLLPNSSGSVEVDGDGSIWSNSSSLFVGVEGTGALHIRDGGTVENTLGVIANDTSGSTSTVTVTDTDSLWDNSGLLIVGQVGEGRLEVSVGGRVNSAGGVIGQDADSQGEVIISDPNTLWHSSGVLKVGDIGDGALTIEAGGRVENTSAVIAHNIDSTSTVTVTDAGSVWENSGELAVGREGEGILRILDGGRVNSVGGRIGVVSGIHDGNVEVRGENSEWIVDGSLSVAGGLMDIRDGGRVQSDEAAIGVFGEGFVIVEGPGSTWAAESLQIGSFGGGTLTIDAGGVVNINAALGMGASLANGRLNLNGGEINLGSLSFSSVNASINFTAGTFRFTGDYLLDDTLLDFVIGDAHTIGPLQHLAVAGKPTMETPLFLEGGTFSAGSLVRGSPLFFNSGTFNLTSDDFTIGAAGLFGDTLALSNRNVNITNTATIQSGARLQMQGGSFSAGALINQGTIDFQDQSSQVSGGLLTNTGAIRGSGSILNNIQNNTVGQIQTVTGQRLEFGGAVTNAGAISLVGGQMQFNAAVTNSASTGMISARDGTVRFLGGLSNNGSLVVSIGATDVFGDVSNAVSGRIIVSGGGQATFYDDVANGGTINVSASGPAASTAIFLGSLSGNGVAGAGQVFIEGDARPGFSAASMNFGGDVTFGPSASVEIEIGGAAPGAQHDRLQVAGDLALDGSLDVSIISGFTPAAGQSFDILDWGILEGVFSSIQLPTLPGALAWNTSQLYTTGILSVISPLLDADFDEDGDVDANDLTRWRNNFGTGTTHTQGDADGDLDADGHDFLAWQQQLGSAPAVAATAAVPEPGVVGMAATLVAVLRRRRRALLAEDETWRER